MSIINDDLVGQFLSEQARVNAFNDDQAIVGSDIAPGTISSEQLALDSVTSDQLGPGSVTTDSIVQNAITSTLIADGAIITPKLAANSITADKLAANFILASLIQAGAGAQHVELDGSGLRAYDASGNLILNIPDDGSPISLMAQIIASALSVTGNAIFAGAKNELGLGATLQLDASQGDPAVAPSLAATWDSSPLPIDASYDTDAAHYARVGLDFDAVGGAGGATAVYWMATNKSNASLDYALELKVTDGTVNRVIPMSTSGVQPLAICRLGSYVYVLSKDTTGGTSTSSGATGDNPGLTWYDYSLAGTDDQVAGAVHVLPTSGTSYKITSVVVNCGGHSGSVTGYGVVWDSAGNVLGKSAGVTLAAGHADHTFTLSTPVTLAPGASFRVGFARTSSGMGEWGTNTSGGFYTKQQGTVPGSFASPGFHNAYPYYGTMKNYANWTKTTNTLVTAYAVRRYLQSTLALDATYSAVSFPVTQVSPVMCDDGTNIYIFDKASAGNIVFNKYDAVMARVGSTVDTAYNPGTGALTTACAAGNFDFGAARFAVAWKPTSGAAFIDTFTSAGARQANERFSPSSTGAYGITYDGTRFFSLPPTGAATTLTKHSTWTWTTASSIYWVGYSWPDTNATGGTHDTGVSPRASITLGRRQLLTITAQGVPGAGGTDDPNNIHFYALPNATDPGATAFKLQATQAAITLTMTSYSAAGAADIANNYATGGAATLQSQTGGWWVKGDGTVGSDFKARMHQTTAQAVMATTVLTALVLDTIDYDPNGDCSVVSPGSYTVPLTGWYRVWWGVGWALVGPTLSSVMDGTAQPGDLTHTEAGNASGGGMGVRQTNCAFYKFSAGAVVTMKCRQDSGGNAAPQAGYSFLAIEYAGS